MNLRHSDNKKFQETIVFVHHFGGNKHTTLRHQDLVLKLGFDCVSFDLYQSHDAKKITSAQRIKRQIDHLRTLHKSFVTTWVQELDAVLDQIEGPKILYTFSSPSSSAAGVIGYKKRKDIKAWICDGGPFLRIWECFRNYAIMETDTTNVFVSNIFTTMGFLLFGGIGFDQKMKKWLKDFPEKFPILSLRADHDELVPANAIQEFFNLSSGLNPQVVHLPNTGHLQGIKTDKALYESKVTEFLQKHSTPL